MKELKKKNARADHGVLESLVKPPAAGAAAGEIEQSAARQDETRLEPRELVRFIGS